MMNLGYLRKMVDFNDWANRLVLDCVANLTEEQYALHLGGSHPTIREALAHNLVAEWAWLSRWRGTSPTAVPDWAKQPSFAVLREQMDKIAAERAAFLETLTEADLEKTISYTYLSGVPASRMLGDLLVHVVNHATFHRGQVVAMIRQLGVTPPGTDYVVYCSRQ